MRYINRNIESIIKKAAREFPAIIITGPRQSGKTTLLKHLFLKTHRYVSLDNPDIRLMAAQEPVLFLKNYPPPVIIDEIQYAPGLFSYLKIYIDENRSRNGQFLLTGSQNFPLMAGVSESLSGRIAVFTLLPFSIKEQLDKNDLTFDSLKRMTIRGGFPEICLNRNRDAKLWFSGYLQTYLDRDVRQLRQIGDLMDFQRFLELLASLNGQVLNLSGISRDLGVAVNTVKAWISVLEAGNQIILIKPFYKNRGKRITKSSKIYFVDTGMVCFLNRIFHKEQIFSGPLSGQLFENVVLGEIIRSYYNKGEIPRVYWWRTSNGQEVDFILELEGKLLPVEVKMTSKTNGTLTKNLASFCSLFKTEINKGILVNLSDEKLMVDKNIDIYPLKNFIELL